jgi:hypothetical protein
LISREALWSAVAPATAFEDEIRTMLEIGGCFSWLRGIRWNARLKAVAAPPQSKALRAK